jgi:hypothetical protein
MRGPTKAEWIIAGRWIRDHAPAFTVSFVTFTALWFAVVLACVTLYVWDASFYHSLAPPGMELTFMAAGVVFRTFVIFGGLSIIWIKQNTPKRAIEDAKFLWWKYQRPVGTNYFAKAAQTLRYIWIMGLCACGVAALGFVTEGNDFHYRSADAVTQTETATTESADVTIKRATDEKAAIRADRDALVSAARKSMDLVLDDGNSSNDDVGQYEANIATYQSDAAAKLDAQDAIIAAAEASRLTAKTTATKEAVGDPGLPAVFRAPARYIPGWDGVAFRDAFAFFWVVLIESCGSVGAMALLAVQMAMSKRKAAQEAGAKGGKTTARRNRVNGKLQAIEDLREQKARETQVDADADAEDDDDLEDDTTPRQAAE